jgi:hypothetical protein
MLSDILRPIGLTLRLLARFWPQLVALVLAGIIANDLLLQLAARTGLENHLAGLAVLTLVALAQLVVTVAMFQVLRPALPRIRAAQAAAGDGGSADAGTGSRLAQVITIALLPFFAYYAAWGFLGDTVRQYSRLALDLAPFGESGNVLDALDSRWLLVSVAVAWAVRWLALRMQKSAASFWQVVVVICETNWIFVGLYVISRWKDSALEWLMSRSFWSLLQAAADGIAAPIGQALAEPMVPVEVTSVTPAATAINLFFYMLLPLIWLVMAALIYGYDVRDDKELMRIHRRVERFGERYRSVPKFFRDFVEHFVRGYRSRYLPIANGVRLAMSSSLLLLVTLVVGYRFIDWAAAWLWLGSTRLIGPHDLDLWQVIAHGLTLLFGSPYQDSSTGILIEPLRICFLAAVLETAFALPRRDGAEAVPAEAAE